MSYFRLEEKLKELQQFSEIGNSDVLETGFNSLNGFVGLKLGYPIFIGGAPFSGKTEFAFELQVNASILYGWKHFIYCGEGGNIEHIYHELLHKYLTKPYKFAEQSEKIKAEYFISSHFIVCDHDQDYTINEFYDLAQKAEDEYKIKFSTTLFDPFNDVKEQIELFGNREDKFLAHALKQVRVSSKKNKRVDIIVNHIADVKAIQDKSSGNFYMRPALPNEWAGGRTWWRRAFIMILIYRPPIFLNNENGKSHEENETHVIIQKSKPKGVGKLGKVAIFWDWKRNGFYSYDYTGQKLFSCEKNPNTLPIPKMEPQRDFLESQNSKNDIEDMPF